MAPVNLGNHPLVQLGLGHPSRPPHFRGSPAEYGSLRFRAVGESAVAAAAREPKPFVPGIHLRGLWGPLPRDYFPPRIEFACTLIKLS